MILSEFYVKKKRKLNQWRAEVSGN